MSHTSFSWTAPTAESTFPKPSVRSLGSEAAGAGSASAANPTHGLLHSALQILRTPNVDEKAALALQCAEDWAGGKLSLAYTTPLDVPDKPCRPDDVKLVHATRTNSKSKKGLIHSLVHAESYAIDLSADILVRFAFAGGPAGGQLLPKAFFDDWVRVLKEEAQHYAAWRDKLGSLGHKYGDMACHEGLWEAATETSHDILARLAVVHAVHEARGLDMFPGMHARLAKSGDDEACATLSHNYNEEIGHVGFGVKWLVHVCRERGMDPVTTYQDMVRRHFPGSIKPPFNHEARLKAGMSPEWYEPLIGHRGS